MSSHKNQHDNEQNDIEIVSDETEVRRFGKTDAKLRDELKVAHEERASYLDGWQRAKADLINYKRTADEESKRAFARGATSVVMDVLSALDSFDMAFGNKEAWEAAPKNWRDGVEYIHQQLLAVLRERGVEPFSPLGEHFDPHSHESIGTTPVEKPEQEGIITAVIQQGYRLNGDVIRPARVHVGVTNDKQQTTDNTIHT